MRQRRLREAAARGRSQAVVRERREEVAVQSDDDARRREKAAAVRSGHEAALGGKSGREAETRTTARGVGATRRCEPA